MNSEKVLVTGATGKTGSETVELLLNEGFSVRALARKRDKRSDRLAELGADVVLGDIHDLSLIRDAFTDVKRAYFCYPPQGTHIVDATTVFAIGARDVGVETVVNMSQITAREDAPSPLSRQHWLSERVLDFAGVGAVHIAATFFVENLFMFGAQTMAEQSRLFLPYGDERHAPVSARDLARVITKILAAPAEHVGKKYVVTGPTLYSIEEMTHEISNELGRAIEYVDIPRDAWSTALPGVPGMTPSLVDHLLHVSDDHKAGIFHAQTDSVREITGTPAESLAESIRRLSKEFGLSHAAA